MSTTDISVIILVCNRTDELRHTLSSLRHQTLPSERFEVIIADDGSAEDIQSVLSEFPGIQIKYIHQPDEGFRLAAARNLGTGISSGRIWVYSDSGIILGSKALEMHLKVRGEHGRGLMALGNMLGTGWGTDTDRVRDIIESNAPDYDNAIEKMQEVGMCDGRTGYAFKKYGYDINCWYLPWIVAWGGHFSVNAGFAKKHNIRWSEEFTSRGGEDNEYGIQMWKAGAKLHFFPDIEVIHYPTPDSKASSEVIAREYLQENYQNTKELILSLHPDSREVEVWCEIGSAANDPWQRAKLFAKKAERKITETESKER